MFFSEYQNQQYTSSNQTEDHEPDSDYAEEKHNNTGVIYFVPQMNGSLLYQENKSYSLKCVAKDFNFASGAVLTLTGKCREFVPNGIKFYHWTFFFYTLPEKSRA